MNKSIRIVAMTAVAAGALSFAGSANAAASASASANAEILSTITVVKDQDLDFGRIAVNGAGNLTVSADESSPAACPATLVCQGARVPAKFTISGTSGAGAGASVREASINLTSGANSMLLDGFSVYFPSGNTLALPTPTSTYGEAGFNVGGTLHVGAAQAAGVYAGTFNVDVDYN
ncbi:MAG: DUF4402 domain-containing protein [Novosphingobium sp.]